MIDIISLTKHFGTVAALDSLSLSVPNGTIFGLVGPNGAGKSTLINILTGIIKPTSGSIVIDGQNIDGQSVEYKHTIGVVPESCALFEGLTGREQLLFTARVYGLALTEAKDRINDLLNVFELTKAGDRLIETYSQGMKKKIAFASAVIHQPRILFLDEPFENVDPVSRTVMKSFLSKIREDGGTIILTSHSLEMVETLCDHAAIIDKGRVVFESKTSEIRAGIRNAVTEEMYQSLEAIFMDLTASSEPQHAIEHLTWI